MNNIYTYILNHDTMKHILLVEDNKDISRNIKDYLELEWFKVTQAFDGEVGIEKATRENYDLILLDLMLPEVDGIDIARKVSQRKQTPIIMITARESIGDRLLGFQTWAIDYLVKPFDLRELHARVLVHIGKKIGSTPVFMTLGETQINLAKREFIKNEESIHLTQKEFLILEKLIELKDIVVSRGDIIESLWWEEALFQWWDNKLDVYISNLRSKLGKWSIKTIKWVGYTLWE